jgi:hypothetical protein
MPMTESKPTIGVLRETALHAALKEHFANPGDQLEASVGRYIVDIVKPDELIEIQTGSFSQIRRKLDVLLKTHQVTLVYPVPAQKWILRLDENENRVSRRKSPRKGQVADVFYELVRMPHTACEPNFRLLVMLINEEVWMQKGEHGSWRRKGWEISDRILLDITGQQLFEDPLDYLGILPAELGDEFTNADLAQALHCRSSLAGKITYTMRKMGLLDVMGKQGRANRFKIQRG